VLLVGEETGFTDKKTERVKRKYESGDEP